MSGNATKGGVSRRNFLLGAGAGATVTAVVASELALSPAAEAMNPGDEEKRSRYGLTEEVKTFYRVNGYEGKH